MDKPFKIQYHPYSNFTFFFFFFTLDTSMSPQLQNYQLTVSIHLYLNSPPSSFLTHLNVFFIFNFCSILVSLPSNLKTLNTQTSSTKDYYSNCFYQNRVGETNQVPNGYLNFIIVPGSWDLHDRQWQ